MRGESRDHSVVSAWGILSFVSDLAERSRVINKHPGIMGTYHSASIHRYCKPSFLATKIVSWNVFGSRSMSIPSSSSGFALLIVKGLVASPQTWLRAA